MSTGRVWLDATQRRALEILRERGAAAVYTDAGWVWPEDIRRDPALAAHVVVWGKDYEAKEEG